MFMDEEEEGEEEIFSLTSFDFNSSFGLYSSSSSSSISPLDDFDAYIEYELRPIDEELEFRVSFSAIVPFPGFHTSTTPIIEDASLNIFFAKSPHNNDSRIEINPPSSNINWDLVPTSKLISSSTNTITITSSASGIKNLVVKLKSIILSLRSISQRRRSWTSCTSFMEKLRNRRTNNNQQLIVVKKNSGGGCDSRKVVLEELKINVLRKLFVNGGNKLMRRVEISKSCPNSIKSSPVRQSSLSSSSSSSSVCGAIAHCKKSLGQADEFCF